MKAAEVMAEPLRYIRFAGAKAHGTNWIYKKQMRYLNILLEVGF